MPLRDSIKSLVVTFILIYAVMLVVLITTSESTQSPNSLGQTGQTPTGLDSESIASPADRQQSGFTSAPSRNDAVADANDLTARVKELIQFIPLKTFSIRSVRTHISVSVIAIIATFLLHLVGLDWRDVVGIVRSLLGHPVNLPPAPGDHRVPNDGSPRDHSLSPFQNGPFVITTSGDHSPVHVTLPFSAHTERDRQLKERYERAAKKAVIRVMEQANLRVYQAMEARSQAEQVAESLSSDLAAMGMRLSRLNLFRFVMLTAILMAVCSPIAIAFEKLVGWLGASGIVPILADSTVAQFGQTICSALLAFAVPMICYRAYVARTIDDSLESGLAIGGLGVATAGLLSVIQTTPAMLQAISSPNWNPFGPSTNFPLFSYICTMKLIVLPILGMLGCICARARMPNTTIEQTVQSPPLDRPVITVPRSARSVTRTP